MNPLDLNHGRTIISLPSQYTEQSSLHLHGMLNFSRLPPLLDLTPESIEKRIELMLEQLYHTSLFHDLKEEEIKEIAEFCKRLELQDGEILIQENDRSHSDLFILCEGYVEIVSNSNTIISNEVVISKNQKELLGEVSWLNKDERTATARCRGPVEVIRVDGDQLKTYLDKNREAGYFIMRQIAILLSKRLGAADTVLKQILWNVCF